MDEEDRGRLDRTPPHTAKRYAFSLACVAAAALVTLLFVELFATTPFALFFAAVMAAAWYGGLRPGLLAVSASALLAIALFLFFGTQGSDGHGHLIRFILFVCVGSQLSLLSELLHGARRRAERQTQLLRESEELFRAFSEATSEAVAIHEDGSVVEVNTVFARKLGYETGEVVGASVLDFAAPESRADVLAKLSNGGEGAYEVTALRKDGTTFPGLISGRNISFRGRAARVAVIQDLTERKRAERALRESERKYRLLMEHASDAILTATAEGNYIEVNRAACELLGYDPEEFRRMNIRDLIPEEDLEVAPLRLREVAEGLTVRVERRMRRKDGTFVYAEIGARMVEEGVFQAIARDVTERRRAEESLRESRRQYLELLNSVDGIVWEADAQTFRFTFVSDQAERLLGYPAARWVEEPTFWEEHIHPEDRGRVIEYCVSATAELKNHEMEYRMVAADGGEVWLRDIVTVVAEGDSPVKVRGIMVDISDRRRAEERLRHEALHDRLTGLPNRAAFTEHLRDELESARSVAGHSFAVLLIDIDRFKNVNDSLGHTAGDRLITEMAERLRAFVRPSDVVARFGGDEFTVLLGGVGEGHDAARVAARFQHELTKPFHLGGREIFGTVSVGITLSAYGYGEPEEMLRDADTAMYHAKAAGRACHEIFDRSMHARALARLEVENSLRRGIERGEFRLEYQPIVSLAEGNITGFEALVRWQHPERGVIPPGEFIPVAEETGLIVPLGHWILAEACRRVTKWQRQFPRRPPLTLNVNLSARQFAQPDLVELVERVLAETGIDRQSVHLEITESVVMENAERTATTLERLRALGVQLSIDDFGTGYSSLSYLHRFPVNTMKIDRSFVKRMGTSRENAELVRTIVSLASDMGMKVVAEGVETPEQLAQLRRLNCEYGQGWLFSKSLPEEQVEAMLNEDPHWN